MIFKYLREVKEMDFIVHLEKSSLINNAICFFIITLQIRNC